MFLRHPAPHCSQMGNDVGTGRVWLENICWACGTGLVRVLMGSRLFKRVVRTQTDEVNKRDLEMQNPP